MKAYPFIMPVLLGIAGTCLATLIVALVIYIANFSSNTLSNDPASWGVFGDYVGGVLNPLLTVINICVSIWIAILISSFGNEQTEKQLEAQKRIVIMTFQSEALTEFKKRMNTHLDNVHERINDLDYVQEKIMNASVLLAEFELNYQYFFDFEETNIYEPREQFEVMKRKLSNHGLRFYEYQIESDFFTAYASMHSFYARLGEFIIR